MTDFAAISEIASISLALVAHPSVPAKSVRELIALAQRAPGKLNIAIAGAAGELMGNALMLKAKVSYCRVRIAHAQTPMTGARCAPYD